MKQIDKEIETLKSKMAVLATYIDIYGYDYWPLFERLDVELKKRERIRKYLDLSLSP